LNAPNPKYLQPTTLPQSLHDLHDRTQRCNCSRRATEASNLYKYEGHLDQKKTSDTNSIVASLPVSLHTTANSPQKTREEGNEKEHFGVQEKVGSMALP
jgi:hypothetical protein